MWVKVDDDYTDSTTELQVQNVRGSVAQIYNKVEKNGLYKINYVVKND